MFRLVALLALLASPGPVLAQGQVLGCDCYCGMNLPPPCSTEACVSACGGSSGGASSNPYGPANIAWGGMINRISNMIEECGPKPACRVFRATFGYPFALMFDGPYYAVKGVGYGLYYGGKGLVKGTAFVGRGVGKGFAAIGRGIAAPFKRDTAKLNALAFGLVSCSQTANGPVPQSPAVWDQCKKAVLRRQKAMSKLYASNKENERWCRKNIPLDSGPARFGWEQRCNPGVQPLLIEPFADPLNTPSPTTSAFLAAPSKAAPPAPAAAPPAPAVPPKTAAAAGATPQATAVELGAEAAAAQAAIDQKRAAAAEAPAAATPAPSGAVRDPRSLQGQPNDEARAAGAAGFDSAGAMLGKAGAAPALPSGGPMNSPARAAAASPSGEWETRGAMAGPEASGAARPAPATMHPQVLQGAATLVGNPNALSDSFKRQTGQTCAIVSALQVAGALGKANTEDDLFWWAFKNGHMSAERECKDEFGPYMCFVVYDAETGRCKYLDVLNHATFPPEACDVARMEAATTLTGMGRVLEHASGKPVVNSFVPPLKQFMAEMNLKTAAAAMLAIEKTLLPKARAEVLDVLKAGKPVIVSLDAATLWREPRPRGLHAVTVTSAVMGPKDLPVGYYINDTGSGEHARFVPLKLFERAWLKDDLQRLYVK
ncbi:MAG: hypothetical protein HY925_05140 [Elusimicrobia bacterium]|nr:hypothetical protein [Elusimicrobiota bacterium]